MARKNDPGAGASYEAGATAGPPLEGVMAGDDSLNLGHVRALAGQGGHPGHDPSSMPFGAGDSAPADWPPPGAQTWAAPSGAG